MICIENTVNEIRKIEYKKIGLFNPIAIEQVSGYLIRDKIQNTKAMQRKYIQQLKIITWETLTTEDPLKSIKNTRDIM